MLVRLGDTWAWVALGSERKSIVAAGDPEATKDALDADEGDQAIPKIIQAPQPPPAVASTRTMEQRFSRLEEEVHNLRGDIGDELGTRVMLILGYPTRDAPGVGPMVLAPHQLTSSQTFDFYVTYSFDFYL
ncbi:hypothetical protein Tco_1401702 [Tanacetum coccineum]